MGLLEVALAIGGLMSAGGKIASGIGQANASAVDADLKNKQADEILLRNAENAVIIQDKAVQSKAGYETGVAAQGSASAGIGGELQIQKYANEQIANATQEANFNATMTRAGAAMEAQLGQEQAISGIIGGVGGIATDLMKVGSQLSLPNSNKVDVPIGSPSGTAPSLPMYGPVNNPAGGGTVLTPDSSYKPWNPFGGS